MAFAAFFSVAAIFVFGLKAEATVGKGIVEPGIVGQHVVFDALVGAIVWNLLTWWDGIPFGVSHALIGDVVGATLAEAGTQPLGWAGALKTLACIVVSPLMGFLFASLSLVAVS